MAEEKLTGMPEADIKKAWEFYEKFTLPRRVLVSIWRGLWGG